MEAMNNKFVILSTRIIWIALVLITVNQPIYAGGYHAKYKEITPLISMRITENLIHHNICENKNDCVKKRIHFYGPTKKYLEIHLYQITDWNVLSDIVESIIDINKQEEQQFSILFKAHKVSHKEKNKMTLFDRWFRSDVLLSLVIEGEK